MESRGKGRWYALGSIAVTVLIVLVHPGFAPPQSDKNSELKWLKLTEGLDAAKKRNKKLLVDVYTDWCGWCKKMDAEVYTDAAVKNYLNEKYVVVKMNAESPAQVEYAGEEMSERQLSSTFGVTGFPTTIFLLPNGDPITMLPGFVAADQFLNVLTYIGDDHYEKMKYDEFLEKR